MSNRKFDMLNVEVLKLYFKENSWVVEYQNDDGLRYSDLSDAIVSIGILSKELTKFIKFPLKILIYDKQQKLCKESFIFPSLYEVNRNKLFRESLINKLIK